MKTKKLAFIDIETTGLDFDANEIIEIAGVVVSDDDTFTVFHEFECKVKPEHIKTANRTALKINKYNDEDWKDALTLTEAMQLFSDKTEDAIMAAHNSPFDWAFLDKAFRTTGVTNKMGHYHTLDTVSVAYIKLRNTPEIKHFSLHELCEYFGIKNEKEHSALGDAKATLELYKKLINL